MRFELVEFLVFILYIFQVGEGYFDGRKCSSLVQTRSGHIPPKKADHLPGFRSHYENPRQKSRESRQVSRHGGGMLAMRLRGGMGVRKTIREKEYESFEDKIQKKGAHHTFSILKAHGGTHGQ
jgi:hypothetical protein